jgi:hypothetical protein
MPSFLIHLFKGVGAFIGGTLGLWSSLPETTRVILALGLCVFLIFNGSRAERTGVSVTYFFSAFAVFAYIFDMGIHMMQ